jgi:serine protease Do
LFRPNNTACQTRLWQVAHAADWDVSAEPSALCALLKEVLMHTIDITGRPPGFGCARLMLLPLTCAAGLLLAPALAAQTAAVGTVRASSPLRQLSDSVEALVKRVSPSVVQILVTGYGPLETHGHSETDLVIGRQRGIGSGVVIDADGYIVTNAHVVANAQRVRVVVPGLSIDESPVKSLAGFRDRTLDARIVGIARDMDLALLKVDASGLPALPIGNYDDVRQGEMVFAFGSPDGLRDSVTMGVVSAVARQTDPDDPRFYLQTDTPINPGNSGGPLVNVDGELVGINTFIITDSGGNQGLGFAIPSAVVAMVYPKLKKYGYLDRGEIGVSFQTITPTMATALGLQRARGIIVSDVVPGGPADTAGLRGQDIILSIDGQPMDGISSLLFRLYIRNVGDHVKLGVLRGSDTLSTEVIVAERPHDIDRLIDLVDPDESLVGRLGIMGVDIDVNVAHLLPQLRLPSGVIVAARVDEWRRADVELLAGDVIHALNGVPVMSLDGIRSALDRLQPKSPVVLQIERGGKLMFVTLQLN